MKIETIVNYGVPDEDKALLADIKGHREQELEEIKGMEFSNLTDNQIMIDWNIN